MGAAKACSSGEPSLADLPVFGVAGWSGSGKTTLIEAVVAALTKEGLRVAAVKHDVHGVAADPRDKDTDRLFRAGADVMLQGPGESLARRRTDNGVDHTRDVCRLASSSDLVLVEGQKRLSIPKVWLLDSTGGDSPGDVSQVIATLPWDADRSARVLPLLREFVAERWARAPVWGCVLMGGQSARMGAPKHLLRELEPPASGGRPRTWLERTVDILDSTCDRTVLSGEGDVPQALRDRLRVADIPGIPGPMAGVLSALRWAPFVRYLVVSCDLPWLTAEAVEWLRSTARPGVWAVLPRATPGGPAEPLFGLYDFRARELVEDLATSKRYALSDLSTRPHVRTPQVPHQLRRAWRDADTPEDL